MTNVETPTTEPDVSTDATVVPEDADETPDADQPTDETEPDAESEALAKVRREAKNLRERLKVSEARTDALARRLHAELTRASGKLADPSDLAFSAAHVDNPDALAAAIDGLLEAKPHLRSRIPSAANVGQGAKDQGHSVGLLTHLKSLV